jgi:hypothetical protein
VLQGLNGVSNSAVDLQPENVDGDLKARAELFSADRLEQYAVYDNRDW